ncbi:right-handed parallel beta-helix repeat-containing protein [Salinibacterium sp. SYSU T00001]|uniref:right-handed parallel beta-helix repeat-containing protein n=1 Tax=Homoserinimonas sedimenticola TaxID=2986805 RepID=UPI0022363AE3|nr:right-handed parallel beta-helix repeat-containing protein [Salinibacterium sedimenticola]MCW4384767.1 right-handed parallel beta-helix repeat-containing protein [Salinibacterium sedimenticola]
MTTSIRSWRRTRTTGSLIGAVCATALLVAGCTGGDIDRDEEATPSANALVVSPDGSGDECTAEQPCALESALGQAIAGSIVQLLGGEYGEIDLGAVGSLESVADSVIVEPAPGAEPAIDAIRTNAPNITWRDLAVDGVIYLDDDADGTTLDAVHVQSSGLFIHASDVTVTESLFEGGSSIDGIQFSGASNVLIENSVIRDYDQTADNDVHADCVQIFDSSNLVLRGNYIGNCHNASIIFSPGNGDGISNVVIEANHIQGCVVKNELCGNGTLLDLREFASDVVVRNNTMIDGSVLVEDLPGLVFDRNVIDYVSNCDMPMTNTIVARWNTGLCDEPAAIGEDGNRVDEVEVMDRAAGDLRLVNPDEATIDGAGDASPAEESFDGEKLSEQQAGAG